MKEAYYIFDGLDKRKAKILKSALYTIPDILRVKFFPDNGTVSIEYDKKKPTEHMIKMAGIYARAQLRTEIKNKKEIRKAIDHQ